MNSYMNSTDPRVQAIINYCNSQTYNGGVQPNGISSPTSCIINNLASAGLPYGRSRSSRAYRSMPNMRR